MIFDNYQSGLSFALRSKQRKNLLILEEKEEALDFAI